MNLTEREKRFIIVGIIIVIAIFAFYGYGYYRDTRAKVNQYIDMKLQILDRQMRYLAQKDILNRRAEKIKKEIARLDLMFLSGERPPVAAARLQELMAGITSTLSIQVKTERALSPVDMGYYFAIPVEIGFVTDTQGLRDLLVRLRKNPALIVVSDLKIRVVNVRKPDKINVTMVVTGLMKKPELKGMEKKDVT